MASTERQEELGSSTVCLRLVTHYECKLTCRPPREMTYNSQSMGRQRAASGAMLASGQTINRASSFSTRTSMQTEEQTGANGSAATSALIAVQLGLALASTLFLCLLPRRNPLDRVSRTLTTCPSRTGTSRHARLVFNRELSAAVRCQHPRPETRPRTHQHLAPARQFRLVRWPALAPTNIGRPTATRSRKRVDPCALSGTIWIGARTQPQRVRLVPRHIAPPVPLRRNALPGPAELHLVSGAR